MNAPMTRRRRRRLTPLALAAGVLGSAILGLGATGTYSAITATITNTTNTAGTGSLVMKETDSSGTDSGSCSSSGGTGNSYSCAAFNKYGGSSSLTPGGTASTTTVRIYDTGTLDPAAFTMTPGACTPSNNAGASDTANNICTQLKVTLTCQLSSASAPTVSVYSAQTLSSIASTAVDLKAKGCLPLKGSSVYTTFVFSVQLDSGAQNGVQGTNASQPIVWQFTA